MFSGLLAAGVLALATPAHAELIVGSASFTLGGVVVSAGEIDWVDPLNTGPDATKTYGDFDVQANTLRTGVFAQPVFNTTGLPAELIQDMSNNPADANYVPVGNSAGVSDFLVFTDKPTWQFTETFLQPGALPGAPFVFTPGASGTTVSINLAGIAYDTATPNLQSAWTLVISAQYNQDIPTLIALVQGGGTLPSNSWSGTFNATAVPEPATLLTFGLGSLFLARRRKKNNKA
jgi:hypothetical protein